MSRKNSPNKRPRSDFKPEKHFDRDIITCDGKSEGSLVNFEKYMKECGAIIIGRPYVAVKRSNESNLRKRASEHGISHINQAIPPPNQKDVDALSQKLLPVTDQLVFEQSEEGWIYLYFCNDVCLYVGQTRDYVLPRATTHLVNKSHSPWGEYVRSHQHDYQGWSIKFIRLSDCEALIRKSLILPGEDVDDHMQEMEEEYQESNKIHPKWWLDRAERVLMRAFGSLYNTSGNPSQDGAELR